MPVRREGQHCENWEERLTLTDYRACRRLFLQGQYAPDCHPACSGNSPWQAVQSDHQMLSQGTQPAKALAKAFVNALCNMKLSLRAGNDVNGPSRQHCTCPFPAQVMVMKCPPQHFCFSLSFLVSS